MILTRLTESQLIGELEKLGFETHGIRFIIRRTLMTSKWRSDGVNIHPTITVGYSSKTRTFSLIA